MLFQKRQDFSPVQNAGLGQSLRFELTREFHIDSLFVRLDFTPTAVMATQSADGLIGLLQRVQVQISDGARTRNVVDISGPSLVELAQQWLGGLDRSTAAFIGTNALVATRLYFPVLFCHPQLADPVGSLLLLPAPRFNSNPTVILTFANQAQMDVNVAPTFAIAAGINASIIVNRRQVDIKNWPTLDTELSEFTTPYPSTGNGQLLELPVPGSYTGIMFRDYTTAAARGFIETAGGENRLGLLGTVMRRWRMLDLQAENDNSVRLYPATWANFVGTAYLDFLTDKTGEASGDLGSVLDSNILVATGARLQLFQDITGGAAVRRQTVFHRIYGDLSSAKMGAPASGK